MKTTHKILFGDATELRDVESGSVALVVTSPPYPMIEMWDATFSRRDPAVARALEEGEGAAAFERMHRLLDRAWAELHRVLMPGGLACINVGDAPRTIDGRFGLYANHARVLARCVEIGFTALPAIIWRKQTNAPNKFMGSGTLPAGAYVTLEHEFVLILRKGDTRRFTTAAAKRTRAESALFWEERNAWYSDVWFDLKGAAQRLGHGDARRRSGAFPFELAYRLINMFSVRGDTVLDPFLGTGTTTLAAMAAARNSIGVEIDPALKETILEVTTKDAVAISNDRIRERIASHLAFVTDRRRAKGKDAFKYVNSTYGFPVMTKPETKILLNALDGVEIAPEGTLQVSYLDAQVAAKARKSSFLRSEGP